MSDNEIAQFKRALTKSKPDFEIIEAMLVDYPGLLNTQNEYGHTALMVAIINHKWPLIEYLHEEGAGLEQKNSIGDTAFLLAARFTFPFVLRTLVARGAQTNVQNDLGDTALIYAIRNGRLDVVKYLCEEVVGLDMNQENNDHLTPLMFAAISNKLELVQYLHEVGHVNEANHKGETVLMAAAESGHLRIVQYLCNIGVDMNARDRYGDTALMCAVFQSQGEVIRYLISRGALVYRIPGVYINYRELVSKQYHRTLVFTMMTHLSRVGSQSSLRPLQASELYRRLLEMMTGEKPL